MKREKSIISGVLLGTMLLFLGFSGNMKYVRAEVVPTPVVDEINKAFTADRELDLETVNLTVQKTQPQVISIEAESESTIYIKFDKEVSLNQDNIEIIDDEGKRIQGLEIYKGEENSFIVNLGKSYAESNIVINITNVEDMAEEPNKLDVYSKTLFIPDKTPPRVKKVMKKFLPGSEQLVYIYFNEALNLEALESYELYLQDPSTNVLDELTQKPEFFIRDSIIVATLTNEEVDKVNLRHNIFLANIQDKNKNILEGEIILNSDITSYDSLENKPKIEKIEAMDKRMVLITFNQYLNIVDKAAFLINRVYPETVQLSTNEYGNTVATLTARDSKEFNSDLSGRAALRIVTDNNIRLENELGISVESKTYTTSTIPRIEDNIPPALEKINKISSIPGIIDTIVIEYDENIDFTKLSTLTYSVYGRSINRVYTNASGNRGDSTLGRFVIIELKTSDAINANASDILQITQLLDVYDMQDNKLYPGTIHLVEE